MGCCATHIVGIGDSGGGAGPAGPGTTGAICGLVLDPTGNTTIEASPGDCLDDTNTTLMVSAGTVSANITSSGAGGLDTGSESSDTWYYPWLISTPNPVALMLSASSTAPTMPAGFTLRRRLGVVRNNASSDFMDYFMRAFGVLRWYEYNERRNSAPQRVITNGTATSFADVDCSDVIPPTSELGMFEIQENTDFEEGQVRPNGSTDVDGTVFIKEQEQEVFNMVCPGQIVEYRVSFGGTLTIDVRGFMESLCPDDLA